MLFCEFGMHGGPVSVKSSVLIANHQLEETVTQSLFLPSVHSPEFVSLGVS